MDHLNEMKSREDEESVGAWLGGIALVLLVALCAPAVVVAVVGRLSLQAGSRGWKVLSVAAAACAAVLFVAGWIVTGALDGAVTWHADGLVGLYRHLSVVVGWEVPHEMPVLVALAWMTPMSVPVGLAAAAVWCGVDEFLAGVELQFELDESPAVVKLTKAERRVAGKNAALMQGGTFTGESSVRHGLLSRGAELPGTVGFGTGLAGRPVLAEHDGFLRPTFVQGVPGSGKTAVTNSIGAQLVALGSGWVVVDFKGGRDVAAHYAEVAQVHGRRFHHFDLADPSGGPYTPVVPGAPSAPAYYDPLIRGNATSKADMLLNSVGRDGDAAVYFRSAYEYTQLAYQVADWSGYSYGKGGFECLVDLLNIEFLQNVADRIDLDAVASRVPAAQEFAVRRAVHEVRERVRAMVEAWKRDELTRSAVADTQRLISTYSNGPAAGQWLRPGPPEQTIDLRRAAHEGDIVVFSLSVSTYGSLARTLGTLVLLDMQNTTDMLRRDIASGVAPQWPLYVQVEEFGSATGDAVLGLCNKARDAQVRPILSTQSWADLVAVDGTGVWAKRVLETCGNFLCLRVNGAEDAQVLSGLTSEVTKIYSRMQHQLDRHGRRRTKRGGLIQRDPRREPRVPASVFQDLPDHHMVWVTKHPALATVHTVEEGPNRWWEAVHTVLVDPAAFLSGRPAVVEWQPEGTWRLPGEQPVQLMKAPPAMPSYRPGSAPTAAPGSFSQPARTAGAHGPAVGEVRSIPTAVEKPNDTAPVGSSQVADNSPERSGAWESGWGNNMSELSRPD